MTDLITRLSKLDAPDREADGIVAETFGYPQEVFGSSFGTAYVNGPDMHYDAATWSGEGKSWSAPYFTSSVDAAIALMARLFPGTEYEFTNLYNIVRVTIEMNGEFGGFHGEHVNSLPIALLISLLRAKEASNAE